MSEEEQAPLPPVSAPPEEETPVREKEVERIARPAATLWKVTCTDPDPNLSAETPRPHSQAARALEQILSRLRRSYPEDKEHAAVREDLFQGLAKVRALKPGQDTNDGITIIIPGRRFPVTWKVEHVPSPGDHSSVNRF